MSLGHCLVVEPYDAEKSAALGGPTDSAAAMIRSRAGRALCVQGAPFSGGMLLFEGGEIAARADPGPWSDTPTNDSWAPPPTRSQHVRQQVVAVVLAFILAALLGQIGF